MQEPTVSDGDMQMKMRKQFVAPQLVEEARLATLTLGASIISARFDN